MTFEEIKIGEMFMYKGFEFVKLDDSHASNRLVSRFYIDKNEEVELDELCKIYNQRK